jgi:hypothetical protein
MKDAVLKLIEKCKGLPKDAALASLAGFEISYRVSSAHPDVVIWWCTRYNIAGTFKVSC